MTEVLRVKAAIEDGKVLLWEPHPVHPGGEAFIAGNGRVVEAARTTRVNAMIEQGRLLVIEDEPPADDPEPLEGYDAMTAAEIIDLLGEMTPAEKAIVQDYEAEHKARKTILEA